MLASVELPGRQYQKAIFGNWRMGNQFVFRSYGKKQEKNFKKNRTINPNKKFQRRKTSETQRMPRKMV